MSKRSAARMRRSSGGRWSSWYGLAARRRSWPEFEPSAQAIRNWVAQADRDEGRRGDGLTSGEREELQPAAA